MRSYTEFEKDIIRQIAKSGNAGCFIFNTIDKYLHNCRIHINSQGGVILRIGISGLPMQMQNGESSKALAEIDDIQNLIVRVVSLTEHLISERLVISFLPSHHNEKAREYGQLPKDSAGIEYPFPDPHIGELLAQYSLKLFIPSPDLIELVQNDFRNPDERRFRWQQRATVIGIAVAIFAVVLRQCSDGQSSRNTKHTAETLESILHNEQLASSNIIDVLKGGVEEKDPNLEHCVRESMLAVVSNGMTDIKQENMEFHRVMERSATNNAVILSDAHRLVRMMQRDLDVIKGAAARLEHERTESTNAPDIQPAVQGEKE